MRIKELAEKILYHKKAYYSGKAEISDFDFDALENELRLLDPQNPVLSTIGSQSGNNKVAHSKKMLSLQKVYDLEDLVKWQNNEELIATYKIDGSSCSLVYEQGFLVLAKTRGDGEFGENITSKILFMQSIPQKIDSLENIEVRGEIYITKSSMFQLAQEMENRKLEKPNSMRNIVAGILGRKENIDLAQFLTFQAYELLGDSFLVNEDKKLEILKEMNFIIPSFKIHQNINSIKDHLQDTLDFMEQGDYLIDGMVFTFNKQTIQDSFGYTAHHPKYKMAYKFRGNSARTMIQEIIWQVSRNGILTPVAQVDPVDLSGAMISRVTLHNYGVVQEFHLKKNDLIEIERSGEVIPKFIAVIKESDDDFIVPTICPCCHTPLTISDIWLSCENKECSDRNIQMINYYIKNIGIEDLSSARIKEMFDKKIINKVPDLYLLTEEILMQNISGVKEKLSKKLIKNIQNTQKTSLLKFIAALGISNLGMSKIEKILQSGVNTLDKFRKLTVEDIEKIEGFASKSAIDIVTSLQTQDSLIEELLSVGIVVNDFDFKHSSLLDFKKFCITGTLSKPRKDIEQLIKKNGGLLVSSVTAQTDYLVSNDINSTSSKFKSAEKLGVPKISETELEELISSLELKSKV